MDGNSRVMKDWPVMEVPSADHFSLALLPQNENELYGCGRYDCRSHSYYGMFHSLANLMNSEIIGKVTDVSWAFVFERVDMQPRHPAQLYEAIAYFILFLVMMFLYKNYSKKLHRGFFFGLCLTAIFTFRFFVDS